MAGTFKSLFQLAAGYDPITGETIDRRMELAGLALSVIPGGKLLTKGKKLANLGEELLEHVDDINKVAKAAERGVAGGPRLLPGEGSIGTADDLIAAGFKGDDLTPHHIPSANRMSVEGVKWGDGIAMNMQQPLGAGGRHRATFTYGTQADINMTPREALAAGVWDARRIYRADGLYTPQIRSNLQELIQLNKTTHPTIFVRPTR